MNASKPAWVNMRQAAEHLNVSEATIRRWIAEGDLPAVRIGHRNLRIRAEDLDLVVQPILPTAAAPGAAGE